MMPKAPSWVPYLVGLFVLAALLHFDADKQSDQALEQSRESLVDSCERVNVLRREFNERADGMTNMRSVLWRFIGEAETARKASGDKDVAREYAKLRDRLEGISITRVDVPKCEEVIAESNAGF